MYSVVLAQSLLSFPFGSEKLKNSFPFSKESWG